MTAFKVKITGGRKDVEYLIHEQSHHDTALLAATEGLNTYRRHGHGTFPFNRDTLTVTVERAEDA